MAIEVRCRCGQVFQTREENAGRRARCPDCGHEMVIPTPDEIFVIGPDFETNFVPAVKTSGLAIASLTFGLCFFCVAFTGIPAILLGAFALVEIRWSGGRIRGRGLAITGIVLGIIISLLSPYPLVCDGGRHPARRAQCVNNLKQIALAMHNYESANSSLPPAAITDRQGRPLLSWRVALLPYLEEQVLYNKFHLDEPWNSPHNLTLLGEMPPVYACPSDPTRPSGRTNYQVIIDPHSAFRPDFKPVRFADIPDGNSNTLLVVETLQTVPWTAPDDIPAHVATPQFVEFSHHSGGFNASFVDGSVRFLKSSLAPAAFRALITRDGGEVVDASSF